MTSILVVDDCAIDRRLIGHILGHDKSWRLQFAEDGDQAIELLSHTAFDLVVSDLQMPHVDGLELVKFIRSQKPQLPIVLVTSQGSQEIAVAALRHGATNYSPKSKLSRDLFATAKHVLEISEQVKEHSGTGKSEQTRFCYVLENDAEMVVPLIATLEENLPSWTEADRLRIGMAINEAVTNAIIHGNLEVDSGLKDEDEELFYHLTAERQFQSPYAERRVRLDAEFTDDRIIVAVTDQGPGFDPNAIDDPCRQENIERLSGRGLLLIRSFMDSVEHNSCGNCISMIKNRGAH